MNRPSCFFRGVAYTLCRRSRAGRGSRLRNGRTRRCRGQPNRARATRTRGLAAGVASRAGADL